MRHVLFLVFLASASAVGAQSGEKGECAFGASPDVRVVNGSGFFRTGYASLDDLTLVIKGKPSTPGDPPGIEIGVLATEVTSPNILKILVMRGGKPVIPIKNKLMKSDVSNAFREKEVHMGYQLFACSAFAPGAPVTVTFIPERGEKITATLK